MNTMDHIQLDRLALLNELDDLHAQLPELEIELDRIQAAMGAINVGNNLYDVGDAEFNRRMDVVIVKLDRMRAIEMQLGYPHHDVYTMWGFIWLIQLGKYMFHTLKNALRSML
jgi:hypothetical protein